MIEKYRDIEHAVYRDNEKAETIQEGGNQSVFAFWLS